MSAITKRACGQRPRAHCNMAGEESIPVIAGRSLGNLGSLDKTEAVIVVAIRRPVPVAVRGTQIPRIIVPGAAANNGPNFDRFPARSHPLEYHPGKYLLQQGVAVGVMSVAQPACHRLAHRVTRYPPLPVARGQAL